MICAPSPSLLFWLVQSPPAERDEAVEPCDTDSGWAALWVGSSLDGGAEGLDSYDFPRHHMGAASSFLGSGSQKYWTKRLL